MRRGPITDMNEWDTGVVSIDVGAEEFDAALGVFTLFVATPRAEVALLKLLVEFEEGLGVTRTMEVARAEDAGTALVVVLAVPDFIDSTVRILGRYCAETGAVQVPSNAARRAALHAALPPD